MARRPRKEASREIAPAKHMAQATSVKVHNGSRRASVRKVSWSKIGTYQGFIVLFNWRLHLRQLRRKKVNAGFQLLVLVQDKQPVPSRYVSRVRVQSIPHYDGEISIRVK